MIPRKSSPVENPSRQGPGPIFLKELFQLARISMKSFSSSMHAGFQIISQNSSRQLSHQEVIPAVYRSIKKSMFFSNERARNKQERTSTGKEAAISLLTFEKKGQEAGITVTSFGSCWFS
jgi:hypothetical protein